jgi:signal transduction histidine kinase
MAISDRHPISLNNMNTKAFHLKHYLQAVREPREPPTVSLLSKLDWMLLGVSGCIISLMASILAKPGFATLSLLSVVGLALMRLRKKPITLIHKICFTTIELLILALPSFATDGLPFFPILGLVIVMRSCQRFERLGRTIVSVMTFAVFTLTQFLSRGSMPELILRTSELSSRRALHSFDISFLILKLNSAFSFGLALLFVLLLINALLEERQSRAKLVIAHEQLRQYALRIEDQSALQERNRIAREIHDSLGHTLTAQSIQLDSALFLQHKNTEEASVFLKEAKQLCKQALQEVRQSVTTLRSDPFQGKSLDQIAAALVEEFRVTTAIKMTCVMCVNHPIPTDVAAAGYRVLQESLTNIARHSAATDVVLQLVTQEGALKFQIQDNGKGFDPAQNSTGFGLQGMKERVMALGGQFKLSSLPGEGCQISVKIPLVIRLLA